jgi:pyruvate-formate lyase-activating enzyme
MNCSSKSKELYAVFYCADEATKKITVTTFVPHLNNKKQVKVRCLCDFHAKRFRNKLNYEINELHKNKSYIEENLK